MARGDKENFCFQFVKGHLHQSDKLGFSNKDLEIVDKIIESAISNPEPNEFPDFIFDGGFIEHFQVTSSIENRKGSVHSKKKSNYKVEIEKLKMELWEVTKLHQ